MALVESDNMQATPTKSRRSALFSGCGKVLKFSLLAVLALYIAFLVVLLALKYVFLPDIDSHKPWLEQTASKSLGLTVRIGSLSAQIVTLSPQLLARDVSLVDANGKTVLTVPSVDAQISWSSVPRAQLIFRQLNVQAPAVEIRRLANGAFNIAGVLIDPNDKREGGGLKWLLSQQRLRVSGASVTWVDETRTVSEGAPQLKLAPVQFEMENFGLSHKFGMLATPPAQFGSALDLRGKFSHALFAPIDNPRDWKGELFVQMQRVDLARWVDFAAVENLGISAKRGQGALRAWMNFDDLTVRGLTTDLALTDVSFQFGKGQAPLELARVDGRVQGRQTATGSLSHELVVTDLSLTTGQGKRMAPLNITHRFETPSGKNGARGEIAAAVMDLQTLAELSERLPLSPPVRQALAKFEPKGQLAQLQVKWQAPAEGATGGTRFSAKGQFSGLAITAQPDRALLTQLLAPGIAAVRKAAAPAVPAAPGTPSAQAADHRHLPPPGVPGFANLSGKFDATQDGGTVVVNSEKAALTFPGVFEQPTIALDKLALDMRWVIAQEVVNVTLNSAQLESPDLSASLTAQYHTGGKGPGVLQLDGKLARVQAAALHRLLPLVVGESARHWLRDAMVSGTVTDGAVKIKGDLFDLPFAPDAAGKSSGEFLITAKAKDVVLDYSPYPLDANARWLPIEKLDGTFVLDRTRMLIKDAEGSMLKTRLKNVNALAPNLLNLREEPLVITGDTEGPAQDTIAFVNVSPVSHAINHFTQDALLSGTTRMNLKLTLPLADLHNTKVNGSAQLAGNTVTLNPALPTFSNVQGRFDFSEKGFTLQPTRAQAYEGTINLSGGTQPDGGIAFSGDGTATVAAAKELAGDPALTKLIGTAQGNFKYTVGVNIKGGQSDLRLSSDLVGVTMDFPGVVTKAATQSLPLAVNLIPRRAGAGQLLHDELAITMGPTLSVRLERVQNPAGQMAVVRGGIGINNEAVIPETGTIAIINVKSFDVDAWSRRLDDLNLPLDHAGAAPSGGESVSLIPRLIAVRADELVIGGKRWEKVVAGATREGDVWQINMDATQVSGYATWRQDGRNGTLGRITGKLARLVIPQAQRDEVAGILEAQSTGTSTVRALPGFDLTVDEFELAGKKLGKLEVVANNTGSAWKLEQLKVTNPDAILVATGEWQRASASNTPRTMNMEFSMQVANAGGMLTRLGIAETLRAGDGKLTGKISWKGNPLSMDMPSLSGQLQLEIDKGQFLKSDPGVARLLGILSLQSVVRRLSFDFRDVFAEGFSFDTIRADAKLENGLLNTNNFKMKGAQAAVVMEGTVDLPRETQKLHVVVLPELNAGAVSLAYAFINPAIGLGTLLAQAVMKDSLSKGLSQEWDVTGTWAKPEVIKRERVGAANNITTGQAGQQ